MTISQYDLVAAWRQILDLSRVNRVETSAILTRPNIRLRNLETAQHALAEIGSVVFQIDPSSVRGRFATTVLPWTP